MLKLLKRIFFLPIWVVNLGRRYLSLGPALYVYKKSKYLVILEQRPMKRRTLWNRARTLESHTLAFPYVIFIFSLRKDYGGYRIESLNVFYRKWPIFWPSRSLHYPNLPNIHPNGTVCISFDTCPRYESPVKTARAGVDFFWATEFNNDLPDHFQRAGDLDERLLTLEKWERTSRNYPRFVLYVPWKKASRLKVVLRRLH